MRKGIDDSSRQLQNSQFSAIVALAETSGTNRYGGGTVPQAEWVVVALIT